MDAQPRLTSATLTAWALAAGFELVGFARVEPIPPEHLERWLANGYAADLDWIAKRSAERLDVTRLLPNAKTVISVACNYWSEDDASPIARYARGRDYHATMRDRLRAFRRALRENAPGVNDWSAVDAGPVMEKVWAVRAGLGYVGHNGCLITRKFGSWVLLATVLLDVEVDAYAAAPEPDRCGKCNLCVTACPTDAILPGAVIDTGRCLSYQTIENEGPMPLELRTATAEGIGFGCDICQTVCPLNDAPLRAGDRFWPRPVARRSLTELAAMSPDDYQAWVPGTALARAGYDGLRRNAIYALGAGGGVALESARLLLEKLRDDSDPNVRDAAGWALEQHRQSTGQGSR